MPKYLLEVNYTQPGVQALLDKGSVRSKDMGWRKGLPAWLPLSEVLKPNSERVSQPPPCLDCMPRR